MVTLDVSPLETVAEVKGRLAATAELAGPLRLVCGGALLADPSTFGSLGLDKESIIHCTEKGEVGNTGRTRRSGPHTLQNELRVCPTSPPPVAAFKHVLCVVWCAVFSSHAQPGKS